MSFDDYAEHIYQKHRLVIAIAVLKSKPPNLTSTQYITHLQSKMADSMDDVDVTICSEDFLMEDDDDSVDILQDFDEKIEVGRIDNGRIDDGAGASSNRNQTCDVIHQNIGSLPENISQTTYYNSCPSQLETNIDNVTYCDINYNIGLQSYTKDILPEDVNKIGNNSNNLNDKELDQTQNNNLTSTDPNIDTQKTILYTVHGFTQNYTHYSPSQNDIFIPNKYFYGTNNDRNAIIIAKEDSNNKIPDVQNPTAATDIHSQNEGFANDTICNNNNTTKDRQIVKVISRNNIPVNKLASQETEDCQNINFCSQNINNFSHNQNYTKDSQSILNIQNDKILNNNNESMATSSRIPDNSQNINDYFNEIHTFNHQSFTDYNKENSVVLQNNNSEIKFETLPASLLSQSNFDSQAFKDTNHNENTKNQTEISPHPNIDNPTQMFGPNHDSSQQHSIETTQYEIIEVESDTKEVIPYKVLEEFNKIKTFLKKRDRRLSCDGNSTDSGYRSDSQRNSNRGALQPSGISINQSAYCLLNHIMQCPLIAATREISSEIAVTLGQLIDKLHEDECYPPFLEELLETIDILLQQVYEGQSCEDNEFLKKDEFIQRILLLNKSINIQKHAIEKITSILKKFHEKIADDNVTYELINIDEVENVSYIFHILEILLKKYLKSKDIISQNSQMSQDEDKILKKSSITDIWRKKWNPNFKENSEGSREKRCVLKECSEILNKIIVDCVNSYSLVAFSALKCFNSMQS